VLKNRIFVAITSSLAWLFPALFPWQAWLDDWVVFRFAVGFALYLIPGTLTFLLITENRSGWIRWILGGLALSVFGTGILGLLARAMQLDFVFIRTGFALWGAVALVLFLWFEVKPDFHLEKLSWWEIAVLLAAAGGAIFFSSLARPPLIHDDAFTYNALIYYYQHASRLDFQFPTALAQLEIPRFWIAFWPLVEAMISGLGGVDGLLVTGAYLPPLLACFSFMGIYALARTLDLPRAGAGLAILAQGLSLMRLTRFNQPGNLFFQRLTEDKVAAAFVISLIFFILAVEYLENPRAWRLVLVGLAALAMVFTHPIQFGMACMMIGVYGLPSLFKREVRWKYVVAIAVLAAVVLIPYSFRFGGGEYSQTLSFSLSDVAENDEFARLGVRRIDMIEGTSFYGISSYLTTGLPYEISLVAAIASLFFFWKYRAARFVLAAFLVLGLGMFPYTGWLVGFFTTPFQLWRLTWLMPFGLAFAFLAWAGYEIAGKLGFLHRFRAWMQPALYLVLSVALAAGVVYVRPWAMGNLPQTNLDLIDIYGNYINMGEYMNNMEVDAPVIIGGPDPTANSIIPSLTLKFSPLVFRAQFGMGDATLWKSFWLENLPPAERFDLFQQKEVEYILMRGEPDWMIELQSAYPDNFLLLFNDRRLRLYQVNP